MAFLKSLMKYEESWCQTMGFFNPYLDPYKFHLTDKMPVYDKKAYAQYPAHNFVYDKLWIAQSQGLACGELASFNNSSPQAEFPLFIKPRWGHLTSGSKNCFKIQTQAELQPFLSENKDMIWSEFLPATEGMTDYMLLKGQLMHQITYIYSEKQNGFTDDWKFITPTAQPPPNISEWVEKHLQNFTGLVNVQYRGDKIIEVGLRLARGGAYIIAINNPALTQNINNLIEREGWDFALEKQINFQPFYVFKCFTTAPYIIYLFPQWLLDFYIKKRTKQPFYEYYFEPAGKDGLVFYQFMDTDFKRGMETKKILEQTFSASQYLFIFAFIILVFVYTPFFFLYFHFSLIIFSIPFLGLFLLWLTRFLNPISANYSLYKARQQQLMNED